MTAPVPSQPILVACEGTGCPTHATDLVNGGICQMCGQVVGIFTDRRATPHKRDDILARIERGDFE